MKIKYLFLYFAFLTCSKLFGLPPATTLYSITDGDWNASGTWSESPGGASCACTPSSADVVHIYHDVVLDINLTGGSAVGDTLYIHSGGTLKGTSYNVSIKTGGVLVVDDTLEVNDMTWDNGSYVYLNSGSYTLITGDLSNSNNSDNVIIDGDVKVNGDLTNGVGGEIVGGGSVDVDGTITNNGTIPGALLPIELVYFNATIQDNNEVVLNWATALEINNQYFTLEKGTSIENLEAIATLNGAGNTTSRTEYSFIDQNFIETTNYYYRLKQTDFDGTSTYSPVVAVSINSLEFLNIFPNPAVKNTTVSINANESAMVKINIYDLSGKMIKEQTQSIIKGTSVITLDISSFSPGNYLIVGKTTDGLSKTQKTFIKH